jgi:hypothetical protein
MSTDMPTHDATDLAPLNRIRVETALSRFPLHRLAKKGSVTIDFDGDEDVKWEVTYNNKHGQPGPLAYKLDTLIVNQRIDEMGRPLPELIKIGSLSDICRSLGTHTNGGNIADVKRAFLQNAFTAINAKIRGKTKTGRDKWFEIAYTRYSVIFTGETLPNGEEADAVYIVLNPPYRELLNHVELRPLDYDYLKQLSPGAQRFYELASFQVYGAIAGNRPRAKMLYSDYCKYAPQTRYPDFEHMKKQMFKVHVPHRESGYITKVDYNQTQDATGATDWEMFYTPGPKAHAEFRAFTSRQQPQLRPPEPQPERAGQGRPTQTTLSLTACDPVLLAELTRRGIAEAKGRDLLANLKPGQELMDQLEYVDAMIANDRRHKIENPAGLYVHYIASNNTPPADFWSSRKAKLHEQVKQGRGVESSRKAELELAYETYRAEEVKRFATEIMPPDEYQRLFDEQRGQYQAIFGARPAEEIDILIHRLVYGALENSGRVKFLTFEEFSRQHPAITK